MIKIYLIRHGLSEGNKQNIFQGCLDYDLSVEGIHQAEKIAMRLNRKYFKKIYSSGLQRAYKTAKIIAEHHGIQVEKIPEFNEMNFGLCQGKNRKQVEEMFPGKLDIFFKTPDRVKFPGGESLKQVQKRVLMGLRKIIKLNKRGSICIVAHGIVNKTILCAMKRKPLSKIWDFPQHNTALNIFTVRSNVKYGKIIKTNDTSHLEKGFNKFK